MLIRIGFFLLLGGFSLSAVAETPEGCLQAFSDGPGEFKEWKNPHPLIGLEFEGAHSKDFTRTALTETAVDFFENLGMKPVWDEFIDGHHYIEIERNNKIQTVELKNEDKLYVEKENQLSVEITSGLLREEKDREIFYSLLQHLKEECALCSLPKSGGVHVHVDYGFKFYDEGAFTERDVLILGRVLAIVEKSLYEYFQVSKDRYQFTQPLSLVYNLNEQSLITDNVAFRISYEKSRPAYVNILKHSINKKKTVEFRFFNSTLNTQDMEFFVQFSKKLLFAIQNRKPQLMKFIEKHEYYSSGDVHELFEILEIKPSFSGRYK